LLGLGGEKKWTDGNGQAPRISKKEITLTGVPLKNIGKGKASKKE